MKVTLTGASGHFGCYTCRALVEAGFEVRATDRIFRKDLPVRVEVADLLDRNVCYGLLEGADAVVHLGNHPNFLRGDAQKIFTENVTINMNIFQAAADAGVGKIGFASSVQVISGQHSNFDGESRKSELPYLPLDGHVRANPCNPYALSKHVSEEMLRYFSRTIDLECVAVRFPTLVDQKWPRFARKSRRSFPALDEGMSFLMMEDAAALVVAVLRAATPGFRIYFPAARDNKLGKPIAEVVKEHYSEIPLKKPLEELESLVDVSAIREEIGWSPEFNNYNEI